MTVLGVALYVSISFVIESFNAALPSPHPPILPETFNFEGYEKIEHWVGISIEDPVSPLPEEEIQEELSEE
jgi:hypothetical protein